MATSLLPGHRQARAGLHAALDHGRDRLAQAVQGQEDGRSSTSIPKDETPGCTREACDFRDHTAEFEKRNAVVLGVSTDPMESHLHVPARSTSCRSRCSSDEDAAVSKLYGVYKQKNLYGKKYMGIERTTFVIDRPGGSRRSTPR